MKNAGLKIVGLLTVVTMLAGCGWSEEYEDETDLGTTSLFTDDGCTHITVATSSEKVNLVDALGKAFKDSPEHEGLKTCVTVKPINVTSGEATNILASKPTEWATITNEEYWPTLWSPASSIWTERVATVAGANLVPNPVSFAQTPVVFAIPESMADALGYPDKPISLTDIETLISDPEGWGSVGKPLWGSFKISKTNPNTSTTGLSTILMQSYEASGKTENLTVDDVNNAEEFSKAFELGAIHYGDTTGKVLTNLYNESMEGTSGSGYVSAIAVEETSLINYNLGNPSSDVIPEGTQLTPPYEKLVAVYPTGGSMWSDSPVTVLNSPWVTADKKTAGEAFSKFLLTSEAQQILPDYGFRPVDTNIPLGDLFTEAYGIQPDQPTVSLPRPDVNVVSVAIDQWEQIRKPSAVLELIDISGSMRDPIGDGRSKLDGAVDGVESTVGHFRNTDLVGIWAFTTNISSKYGDYVVPVRELKPLGSDKETLIDSVNDLKKAEMGGTPLYDSLSIAYDYMTENAEAGRINAIVVLSDGEDTDSTTSLNSLLAKINSQKSETTDNNQVRIFPIIYGNFKDKDSALAQIAKATGGQVFDASDPSKIEKVFAQVINNF